MEQYNILTWFDTQGPTPRPTTLRWMIPDDTFYFLLSRHLVDTLSSSVRNLMSVLEVLEESGSVALLLILPT